MRLLQSVDKAVLGAGLVILILSLIAVAVVLYKYREELPCKTRGDGDRKLLITPTPELLHDTVSEGS